MDMSKFAELNTATKYPSIETYHVLGERGRLTEDLGPFQGIHPNEDVFLTEKVDGTNGRIVLLPGGDYFIGSRENLLYAKGDRVEAPDLSIVPTLKPVAEKLVAAHTVDCIEVLYFEVYGGKIGGQAKNYSRQGNVGYRLFDHAFIGEAILDWPREQISSWHDNGGQTWQEVFQLEGFALEFGLPVVPYLEIDSGCDIPKTLSDAYAYLMSEIGETSVALDGDTDWTGKPEGLVLRTCDRSRIAKMRYQDYERTLNKGVSKGRK